MTGAKDKTLHLTLLSIGIAVLTWSGWKPHDYFTWILEVFPAIIAGIALTMIYPRFQFTNVVYALILAHAIILMIGGHYTYAEMPAFSWLRDTFGLARNYYDRVGHFAQGFVPAMIAREILVRNRAVNGRHWLFFIVACNCPRDQRVLRVRRMVGRRRLGHRRRVIPGHARRRLGYAVGYVRGAVRGSAGARHFERGARPGAYRTSNVSRLTLHLSRPTSHGLSPPCGP